MSAFRYKTALSLVLVTLVVAVSVSLATFALHPQRRPLSPALETAARKVAAQLDSHLEDVEIHATDGTFLRGWFIRPRDANGDDVILLHGVGDNRLGMANYAKLFLRRGYGVLMPDSRAHGLSGGDIATYGLRESADIREWMDWLQANQRPRCIFGLGESMGASLLLESLRDERRYCAVVAESPYATFREVAYDRMGQFLGMGPWVGRVALRPAVEFGFLYARLRYGANLDRVSPEDSAARSAVPVLLIHGHDDNNIPVRHCERIAQHDRDLVFWDVLGAGHTGAYSAQPAEFEIRVLNWFNQHESSVQAQPKQSSRLFEWQVTTERGSPDCPILVGPLFQRRTVIFAR